MPSDDARKVRAEIAEVLSRYCRAWDRCDVALGLSVWHPDGTAQYLNEPAAPIATFIPERLNKRRQLGLVTSHQITNLVVETAGDLAASEAYGAAWSQERLDDGTIHELHYFCRYLDRWSRRDGRWAIDSRVVILDGCSERRFAPVRGLDEAVGRTRMNEDDPSYAHFASLRGAADRSGKGRS